MEAVSVSSFLLFTCYVSAIIQPRSPTQIILLLFGFRQKRSWLVFTAVNLITQAGLNAMLTGPDLGNYWIYGYLFFEIVVLAAELIAFLSLVKEFRKRRVALYVITANIASLIIGGMVITYLPV